MNPLRILMVEDDELDRYILRRVLRKRWPEAQLLEACDGVAAIELLDAAAGVVPDLIMLDVNMPRMGGLEFLEAYYVKSGHEIPVVMMLTSSSSEEDRQRAGDHACVREYLIKPITREAVEHFPDVIDRAA